MDNQFQIGDRVRVVRSNVSTTHVKDADVGCVGVIVGFLYDHACTVDFGEEYSFTHDAAGLYEYKSTYRHYNDSHLELIGSEHILEDDLTDEEMQSLFCFREVHHETPISPR